MRPFVLITDHPPLTAAVAPVITALGYELQVVATWAEGMAIDHQGALVYLTPLPRSEEQLAQHPTPLLILFRRDPAARDRLGGPHSPWFERPRHVGALGIPFDPADAWMRIIMQCVPEQWGRPAPAFAPMDQLWAGVLDAS